MAGPARGPDALRAALERARVAYAAARQSPEIGVREDADVTSASVLLSLLEPAALGAYRTAVLGPLLAWDAQHGTDLLRTLEVFLETGGRWQASADRLHVHENTLRYRIDRVGQLTGRDLASTAGRVDLFLALRAPASGLLEEPPSSS
jgi:DNA-binding PucR family transcriptional regulator